MEIEFDADKDAANRVKHGLSLAAAAGMDFDRATIIVDGRFDYGETRYIAYGRIDGRLHVLWYTRRGDAVRAIGLRKANPRERKRHDQTP